ncbi:MAG TPA: alpha/beta fold hydrolase [Leptospiraceae bacterium]|nr:alpha/beta fold hydrolase [Leptospiraceae bacterium]HMW06959.1 alpha/beta fold hydrolase [Leptospiraceae bacterium]HMX35435.1 alpha/beta fold hydrolase [Leptospiraceae bacterium]HMY30573.1 alpha/beta fold hydrolase [Leptospiraceae bacterium]HMZ65504.1 alpha/beta fold hydrolase [Leptospiraceae bacterium]
MKSYYIDSEDVKLHVLAEDLKENKETILFLHGYPDTSSSWTKQFEYFKDKFRIAAFDLRGIKNPFQDTIPTNFQMENLMQDLDSVIEFLVGSNGKVHLVGHDWGAGIGWSYISDPSHLHRVFTFTAISCPHPRIFYNNAIGKLFSGNFSEIQKSLEQISKSWYMILFQIPVIPELIWSTFTEPLWQKVMSVSSLPANDELLNLEKDRILDATIGNINIYRGILQNGGFHLPELPQEKVTLPISVIIPENDIALSPIVYEGTKEYFPNAELQILQANHWVHREKPYHVNQIIEKFLRDFTKNSDIYFHAEWDTGNLSSGEILIQLKKKMANLNPGNILKLKTKDSGLKDALFSWSLLTGNKLIRTKESEFYIKRK